MDPVGLNETDSNSLAETDIDSSTDHHGESRDRSTISLRHFAKQGVHKGLGDGKPGLQHGSDGVGVNRGVVSVGSTEVTSDSQHVFEISGDGCVPSVGIVGRLKMRELVSAKEFDALSSSGPAENKQNQAGQGALPNYFLRTAYFRCRS